MLIYNRNLSQHMAIRQRNLNSMTRTHTIEEETNTTSPDDQQYSGFAVYLEKNGSFINALQKLLKNKKTKQDRRHVIRKMLH